MISLNGVRSIFRIRYIRAHKLNCSQFWKSLFFSFLFYFFIDMDFFCPPFHRSWLLAFVADVDIFFCFRLEFERKTGEAEKKHKMKNGKRAVAITTHNENENRNNTQVWKRLRHNRVRMFCVCAHFNTCNSRNRSLNRFARHAIAWHGMAMDMYVYGMLAAWRHRVRIKLRQSRAHCNPSGQHSQTFFGSYRFFFSVQCYYICTYVKQYNMKCSRGSFSHPYVI